MGSSLIAYYSTPSIAMTCHCSRALTKNYRQRHPRHDRKTLSRLAPLGRAQHLLCSGMLTSYLHHRTSWPALSPAVSSSAPAFAFDAPLTESFLSYGAITMTILITIFTVLVAVGTGNEAIEWAAIGVIFLFLFVFGYAWQGCVWLYCAEIGKHTKAQAASVRFEESLCTNTVIAPLEYRHIGAGFTAFGEWLMTFITVFAGPIGFENIGWYFWLWVISGNVIAVIFVYLLCPETGVSPTPRHSAWPSSRQRGAQGLS